ncbi:hypothetical protein PCANC_11539 [Puccinia coronata f. sp. avenae]|uniref:Hydrophobin n=1 Tax=Puccinia coronata f. sp. avenae TaxID=200324 RepID=A0A2N5UQG4_9BASI|nr:hypothetical protein PCANC_13896 [Puccinia coronata f. sp. avenae]PLW24388.1 hypothetical protein PCASD_08395 [Puccinia coronata f. sp. avenae]PLW40003.1 hypothetical protein PCANC_11539 [Puccinia coronata f. sp. avenae]PLW42977.1 hypothetical protein PCASD_04727 [Puccinia coronata f. sp. avenae]
MQFLQSILFLACATAFVEVLACHGSKPKGWCISQFSDPATGELVGYGMEPRVGKSCTDGLLTRICCTKSFQPDQNASFETTQQLVFSECDFEQFKPTPGTQTYTARQVARDPLRGLAGLQFT